MPGPLTTVARVRALGGLDDAQAFNLFRLADNAALIARIEEEITVASAWLQSRAPDDYDQGNAVNNILFKEAESYLVLQNLNETLKMRKVHGTHFPLQTEGSERFEELIDVEIPSHIQKFIDGFMVIEEKGAAFAAPVLVTGEILDRSGIQSASQELDDILGEANSLGSPFATLPTTV